MIASRTIILDYGQKHIEVRIIIYKIYDDIELMCSKTEIQFSGYLNRKFNICGSDHIDRLRKSIKFVEDEIEKITIDSGLIAYWDDGSVY